ncbi:MAG: bifunctional aspartate kinase/homoserine dehydrogenase I [Gammaproteobacteria bacterium]
MNQTTSNAPAWTHTFVVHKFGGSSLADAERFENVARILADRQYGPQGVVVSAARGVTDTLLGIVNDAREGRDFVPALDALSERHNELAAKLLADDVRDAYVAQHAKDLSDIADIARATALMRDASDAVVATVAGYGEVWSARLLGSLLKSRWGERQVEWLDARDVLEVVDHEMGPVVNWSVSEPRIRERLGLDFDGTVVITGFVARTPGGVNTTLGRNGSDYSASIFGALLGASQIHIWTDVDGVMTADPRWVSEVKVIEELSYSEAMELAYFGAKVLHPQTMAPAVARQIPIYIRNTFAPEAPGTRIGDKSDNAPPSESAIKGITSIDGMAVVNLEGAGMIGVPGTAQRLFGALSQAGISVVMISQGSSEHSICFAVPDDDSQRASDIVQTTFRAEIEAGVIQRVTVNHGLSVLAVVGDGMAGTPGVAAKVFGSLGEAGVNVRAISQGSSERNISAVIDRSDTTRALRAVHSRFYLSPQTLSIGMLGCGTVGRVLLEQMHGESERLRAQFNLDLRVRALANSQRMCLDERALDLGQWENLLTETDHKSDPDALADHVNAEHFPHAVIIDCTSSQGLANRYPQWLERGIHIITPNKKSNSGSLEQYRAVREAMRRGESRYLYETTVGAGLPILQTLRDLRETGDRVRSVQGIFSGTLAYLFNVYDGSKAFSAIVREAKEAGFTEPDPRDDLSGMDVARKVVILGREMGLEIELDDVEVESLVPAGLDDGDVAAFLDALAHHDGDMAARFEQAQSKGEVLRYVATLGADGGASVALRSLPAQHTFAHINLTDNVVQLQTDRYCDNPLIVQGPGAGPAVTAAGVFADLLRLSAYLGAAV